MKTPEPFSWDRAEARAGKFDGKFLIGVLTTGIYCLPSCTARQPKPDNVRIVRTEEEAQALGLRACKRCRPDLFYRGEDEDISLFEGLATRVCAAPPDFPDARALAKAAGVSLTKLADLFREHAHLTPVAWLRRERVRAASCQLLGTADRVLEVGYASGFESESVFHRQFLALTRMTPGAFRAMNGASVFLLQLPSGYRAQEILAYHARDPQSPCERVEGNRIFKALGTPQGPAVLELSLEGEGAWARVHGVEKMSRETAAFLHASALRMLGLNNEVVAFETRMTKDQRFGSVVARRRGLRVPSIPTGFDGLCWAIIGQQVNVKFAAALRREILNLAGDKIGDMRTHPIPDRVAEIGAARLAKLRYSRAKAEYLVGAASTVAQGRLDIEALPETSAVAAEKKLMSLRGIGRWTARYTMLRGGFADAAPVGDSALATVLQRIHGLAERPDAEHAESLMQEFAPHRSLATCHLWASYKDAA
ncbi:MAG: DNA-3-methyladenine glycosylase 2 family protein [Alphaproteobacteria bacterium]|nr:DNA-3-methyladenine glycosylase 2 family protein [Alphaproteobacteria bacterium]